MLSSPGAAMPYDESTAGPACPVHPGETAHGVCGRCGAYLCGVCTLGGAFRNCAACRQLTGEEAFPYDRQRFEFAGIMGLCWERFKAHWLMLCVGTVIVFGASFAFSGLRQAVFMGFAFTLDDDAFPVVAGAVTGFLMVASFVVEWGVTWALTVGFLRVCLDVLSGRAAEIPRLFGQFRKIGKVVLQGLAASVAILIPAGLWLGVGAGAVFLFDDLNAQIAAGAIVFLLGVVPFTWYVLAFFFMHLELAYNDDAGPISSILHAAAIVRGWRLVTLGTALLAGLLTLAGMLACCIGLLPAWAFGQLLVAGVFLALRNGADVPAAPIENASTTAAPGGPGWSAGDQMAGF